MEAKCLCSRPVFTKIKVDHLARCPEELSALESLPGLRQSSHPFGRRMFLSGRIHLTSPEVLSGWHSLHYWLSLHTLTMSIPLPPMKGQRGGQLFKTWKSKAQIVHPFPHLASFRPWFSLTLDYSPLISISTREMLVESISTRASAPHLQDEVLEKVSHQAMMLPCGLTGVQWETRSRLSIQ